MGPAVRVRSGSHPLFGARHGDEPQNNKRHQLGIGECIPIIARDRHIRGAKEIPVNIGRHVRPSVAFDDTSRQGQEMLFVRLGGVGGCRVGTPAMRPRSVRRSAKAERAQGQGVFSQCDRPKPATRPRRRTAAAKGRRRRARCRPGSWGGKSDLANCVSH